MTDNKANSLSRLHGGWMLAIVSAWLGLSLHARGAILTAADLLQKGIKVNHVSIPIYNKDARQLLAVIRVEHVFKEFERRGMFHIGVLPIEVLDGTSLEVQDGAKPAEVFEQVAKWLGGDAKNLVEMRHVKLNCNGNALEADRITVRAGGMWQLAGNIHYNNTKGKLAAERGAFQSTGEHAGHVVLEGAQRKEAEFFTGPPAN